jgi:serine protease AprX
MKKHTFTLVLLTYLLATLCLSAQANQKKYWIFFKDKSAENFDPLEYFDKTAIERRLNQHLPLYDFYDLPVNTDYVKDIETLGCSTKVISRWLNAAVVMAEESTIEKVAKLRFVASVEQALDNTKNISSLEDEPTKAGRLTMSDLKVLKNQTSRMDAHLFDSLGLKGKGIRICINDVGFSGADKHQAFEHLRKNGKIIATKDFVGGGDNVYRGGWHGTAVLSCIAGIIEGMSSGLATEAEFLLARTEWGAKEVFAEEEFWVAAAEWADKNGARIINSSLGYTSDRYFQSDMNGKNTFITRGANIAARKGILVVNAAGNEGSGKWRIMGAPADADSVLSVGGVTPFVNKHTSFASFGPTWDLRLKPNVSAQATTIAALTNNVKSVDGTSFASPLVAGYAACLWQKFPDKSNMEIFKMIEESGHLYPYFDYAHGYGIPMFSKVLSPNQNESNPLFRIIADEKSPNVLKVELLSRDENENQAIEKEALENDINSRLLYYHIADHRNVLESYFLIDVQDNKTPLVIDVNDFNNPRMLRVFYQGQMLEHPINKINR